MSELRPAPKSEYWPCACVRRDRAGNLKAIKLNHPAVLACRVCKAKREAVKP